ncbi:hypothetical protein CCR80_00340 [Rhodothalassium salexigens]|uniref:FeoA family protein n=1 Tax=Rhodothalassium salexigens TaxID=1086 RepID=UPI00191433F1|nr:FeoA domain-containing protein [Rhodothalassium salexigens]MBK5919487.1 hypothetical protein [Rhodothalassium salexigens]
MVEASENHSHEGVVIVRNGDAAQRLGTLQPRMCGQVVGLTGADPYADGGDPVTERLRELGFEEGAAFEVLHQGPVWGDPMAVRVDSVTVALRRREANSVIVNLTVEADAVQVGAVEAG